MVCEVRQRICKLRREGFVLHRSRGKAASIWSTRRSSKGLPFFARFLATVGYEPRDFEGGLLWFTGWGVWNSTEEAVGYRIVEAMHRAAGQPQSFEAAPGHAFRADELPDAVGLLLQPMIFGWDAYYLPRWSYGTHQFFLHVSHDSFVTVATRTKEFHDRVFSLLTELDLHPKPGHELRMQRFCRVPSPPADEKVDEPPLVRNYPPFTPRILSTHCYRTCTDPASML